MHNKKLLILSVPFPCRMSCCVFLSSFKADAWKCLRLTTVYFVKRRDNVTFKADNTEETNKQFVS